MKVLDDSGRVIDAEFHVQRKADGYALIIESRGPGRNTQYHNGMEFILKRLASAGAILADAVLASRDVERFPLEQRRLLLERFDLPVALADLPEIDGLRADIGRAQAGILREPGARGGGNRTRRLELAVSLGGRDMSADMFERMLASGTPSVAPAPVTSRPSSAQCRGIPAGITREHVIDALADLDRGVASRFGPSTRYDLVHEGRRYPPKAVVGLAARGVLGAPLEPHDFKGGLESSCFRVLENLGFEIVEKDTDADARESLARSAVDAAELATEARFARASSGGQGFTGSPRQRAAIENWAMTLARRHLESLGFIVEDTHANHPYDFVATRGAERVYVEVKGTTTAGESVFLTFGEVEHLRREAPRCALIVVRGIVVSGESASGGELECRWPFLVDTDSLRPISYMYSLKG